MDTAVTLVGHYIDNLPVLRQGAKHKQFTYLEDVVEWLDENADIIKQFQIISEWGVYNVIAMCEWYE